MLVAAILLTPLMGGRTKLFHNHFAINSA
jgi:hypothetical protein